MTDVPNFLLKTPKPPIRQPFGRRDVGIGQDPEWWTVPAVMKSDLN
jgi:hypothetical protein